MVVVIIYAIVVEGGRGGGDVNGKYPGVTPRHTVLTK